VGCDRINRIKALLFLDFFGHYLWINYFFLAPPNLVRLSAFPALVTVLVVVLEPVTDFVFAM